MKKKYLIVIAVLTFYLCAASFTYATPQRAADNENAEEDLTHDIEDIVENLDLSELEEYLASLESSDLVLSGASGLKDRIKAAISGNIGTDYSSFLSYAVGELGSSALRYLPVLVSVIMIAVLYNLLSSLRGKFASDSVKNIVYFACVALLSVVLFTCVFSLIGSVRKTVNSLQKQMSIIFPILLTLMTAVGANSSVAVYKPSVAILAGGIAEVITALIIPAFIITVVLTAVGNLSQEVKLGKLSDFFGSAAKWLLGTSFFIFSAFLGVQGITASVYDGVSVRAAKFALGKYVPIIGGYLSDGLNLVMSGSVLVKNAIGMTAIVLIFVSILPIIAQIVVLSLGLRFAGAVIEPLGDSRMSSLVTTLGKNLNLLVAIVLSIAFLFFIFLILIICTGNIAV